MIFGSQSRAEIKKEELVTLRIEFSGEDIGEVKTDVFDPSLKRAGISRKRPQFCYTVEDLVVIDVRLTFRCQDPRSCGAYCRRRQSMRTETPRSIRSSCSTKEN